MLYQILTGAFENDVIVKMSNFRAPPNVTVSYIFHYTPATYVTRQIVSNFFLDQRP